MYVIYQMFTLCVYHAAIATMDSNLISGTCMFTQEKLSEARDVFEGHDDEDQMRIDLDLGFDSASESDENDDY